MINCKSEYCKHNKEDKCVLETINIGKDNQCKTYNYDVPKAINLKKECRFCKHHFYKEYEPTDRMICRITDEWVGDWRLASYNKDCWELEI